MDVGAHHQRPTRLLAQSGHPVNVLVLKSEAVLLAPLGLLQVHLDHLQADPVPPATRVQDPLAVDPERVEVAGTEVGRLDDLSDVGGIQRQQGAADRVLRGEDRREARGVVDTVREELDPELGGGGEDVWWGGGATEESNLRREGTLSIPHLHVVPARVVSVILPDF